jgi:hypothetical protein
MKLECDPELMARGFTVHGSFYTTNSQSVLVENDVQYDMYQNVNGLTWNPSGSDGSQVQVSEDGIYKLFFLANVSTPSQFTFFVNGVSLDYTTQGTNKGAMQFSLRTLVQLNANDIITVRNHTSSNGTAVLTMNSGGSAANLSAILMIIKVANTCKPSYDECKPCKNVCYEKFREYLLHQECLQITGCSTIVKATTDTLETLALNDSLYWSNTSLQNNIEHVQGKSTFKIKECGIYQLIAGALFNEASQLTLYINGVPNASTISGRDSGSAKLLIRQILHLKKCDELSIVNASSSSTSLSTQLNAGGNLVSQDTSLLLYKLSPPDANPCPPTSCTVKKPKDGIKKGK